VLAAVLPSQPQTDHSATAAENPALPSAPPAEKRGQWQRGVDEAQTELPHARSSGLPLTSFTVHKRQKHPPMP